jgi:hypothetical protein
VNAGDQVVVDGHLTLTHDAPVKVTMVRDNAASVSTGANRRRPQ